MTTLGFATIVTQIAMAWQSVTGGGIGVAGPTFGGPFDTTWGFYYFCLAAAALCTWLSANVAHSRFGRALLAIRDAEVAAEANGISKPAMLTLVFLFAGATAGDRPAACSPRCNPTSRPTPSPSTCRSCSSSPS